jgi:hypothetical protein
MSENAIKWNMSIPFVTKSDYIIRFTELSLASNSKGNPMITIKTEIAAPDTVDMTVGNDTKPVVVAGVKPSAMYMTIQVSNEGGIIVDKTEACRQRWNDFRKKLELPEETNWENPATEDIKKVLAYALIKNEANPKTASPTREELARGIKVGKVLLHPKTKQPLIDNYPEIKEIYCLAELPTGGQSL